MALAYSSTTPAATQSGWLGTSSVNVVSNTFSPPAASLIVVALGAQESFTSAWNVPTFTDSLGSHLTWTIARTQADTQQSFGACWVAWAYCASAQTNMTVTATMSIADAGQYIGGALLAPIVFTGADTIAPIVNVVAGVSTSASVSAVVSPIYTGSNLLMVATRTTANATASTAGSGCYLKESYVFGAAYGVVWLGDNITPTATSGADETLALQTTDSGNVWQYIAFEVAPPHAPPAIGTGWVVGAIEW